MRGDRVCWGAFKGDRRLLLTLQAVRVEEVLALLVALDAALGAPHPLPGDAPEEPLALVAVRRRRGRPRDEVVRRRAADRVDQSLQRLLVHVHFLRNITTIRY